ncbi:MAG: class I SAM-dependent methyltransferase [Planctomycetes bacterium]|nr:class I SAM-dependent methyltransferase [Planctomycetota bacterium]
MPNLHDCMEPTWRDPTDEYYATRAEEYSRATRDLDLTMQLGLFRQELNPGAEVLDLGCGSGRDLRAMRSISMRPVGLDRSLSLAKGAREFSGCPVVRADFHELPFADQSFDGIWAIAALLHARPHEVRPALREVRRVVRDSGLVLTSMQLGQGEREASDGRYFALYSIDQWAAIGNECGLRPVKSLNSGTNWFVTLFRKSTVE